MLLKPFLITAMLDFCAHYGLTPYVTVLVHGDDCKVPTQYIQPDGTITLNLRPAAVVNYQQTQKRISFQARFNGQTEQVDFPIDLVMSVYPKEKPENGMQFPITVNVDESEAVEPHEMTNRPKGPPKLTIVK